MAKRRLQINPSLPELARVFGVCDELGIADGLRLAIEEAVVNVINHSGSTSIGIAIDTDDGSTRVAIEDDGTPFDPTNFAHQASGAELAVGGQGINIIRALTDSQTYSRTDNRNILILIKN